MWPSRFSIRSLSTSRYEENCTQVRFICCLPKLVLSSGTSSRTRTNMAVALVSVFLYTAINWCFYLYVDDTHIHHNRKIIRMFFLDVCPLLLTMTLIILSYLKTFQGPCTGNQQSLAHSRLWDAVVGFLHVFAHMQMKLSQVCLSPIRLVSGRD